MGFWIVIGTVLIGGYSFYSYAKRTADLHRSACVYKEPSFGGNVLGIAGEKLVVEVPALNVRSKPSVDSKIAHTLAKNDVVLGMKCVGSCGKNSSSYSRAVKGLNSNAWVNVCFFDGDQKKRGFVRGDFLNQVAFHSSDPQLRDPDVVLFDKRIMRRLDVL